MTFNHTYFLNYFKWNQKRGNDTFKIFIIFISLVLVNVLLYIICRIQFTTNLHILGTQKYFFYTARCNIKFLQTSVIEATEA